MNLDDLITVFDHGLRTVFAPARAARANSTSRILADCGDTEREDVLAALSYAARLVYVKRMERLAA